MGDLILAWRNVWRNPRRSALTIMAVTFAASLLVFMLSFQFGSYETMINASVRLSTGHLQVQAPRFNEKQEMRKTVEQPDAVIRAIHEYPGVVGVSPRAEAFALAAGPSRTRGIMVTGVAPETEPLVSTLPGQIRNGRYLEPGDRAFVVIGSLLAERLRVTTGDELTLLGQGRDGSVAATVVAVVGIYTSGIDEFDRSTLQMPLAEFNEIFSMDGSIHRVVIATDRLKTSEALKQKLLSRLGGDDLVVLGWAELMPGLKQSIQMDLVSGIIMYVVLIVVVAFSVLNTFLMAIFERTREFGVLMAMGTRPGRLVRIMLMESMAITAMGLLLGMILGATTTLYFSIHGIGMGDAMELLAQYGISGRIHPRLSWLSLLSGPALVLAITFFTALFPALKIPRLKPVDALRAV